jgi:hypothetical protein
MEKAYEDRLDGKLPEALWVKKSKEWERDIDRLERLLRGYNKAGQNFQEEGVFLLELSEKAYSMYEEQDPIARRELLNILCSNLILRDGKVTPEYRQPFDLLEVMKVEKTSLSQETPSEEGVSARWSGWRDSNPRHSRIQLKSYPHAGASRWVPLIKFLREKIRMRVPLGTLMHVVQLRTRPRHPVDYDGVSTKRPLFRSRREAFVG